jgi:branched-chain amino acid transport system ATP-binding protein
MNNTPALEGIGLSRRYGDLRALDNVSISVRSGQIHGLIGSNGAGKSTLMDVLCGRGGRSQGIVKLAGRDISPLEVKHRRAAGLGRSFQRTNIYPDLLVKEQLRLSIEAINADNADEVVDALKLSGLLHRRAGDLSYGDQRRLDLALALIGRPMVVLLDEPTAGLTMEESLKLSELLLRLVRRWSIAVLIVEHDMDVIFSICEHLTVLNLGKVIASGEPEVVRGMAIVQSAYLGSEA